MLFKRFSIFLAYRDVLLQVKLTTHRG